jgi:uncharacterized protein (TIGR03435 family)
MTSMQKFAEILSGPRTGRLVIDKTGLRGLYFIGIQWDEDGDFVSAMQEQLGLRLESQRGPVDVLVVDRIERPAAN